MEQRFHDQLDLMSHYAKEITRDDLGEKEKNQLQNEFQELIDALSTKRGTHHEDQERIFSIQQRKQQIMNWLHDRLIEIDNNSEEIFEPGKREIVAKERQLFWSRSDGVLVPVSEGMILMDGLWDVNYTFDKKTVPRRLRKRYYIEKAKRMLEDELNQQIYIDQEKSFGAEVAVRKGYYGLISDREQARMEGHMAEKMVFSFLKKLTYDHDLPFEIESANVYEDIALKTDFIIKVKMRKRGVNVEETEDSHIIGVQFTIGKKLRGKKGQVDKAKKLAERVGSTLEDIIIVRIPLRELRPLFLAWSAHKNPGGPDELWSNEVKEKIFKGVLFDLLEQDQISDLWQQIQFSQNPFES
jgi:hypothetical protein